MGRPYRFRSGLVDRQGRLHAERLVVEQAAVESPGALGQRKGLLGHAAGVERRVAEQRRAVPLLDDQVVRVLTGVHLLDDRAARWDARARELELELRSAHFALGRLDPAWGPGGPGSVALPLAPAAG